LTLSQFEEFFSVFKSNSRNKALQSYDLGEALQRDVIDPLRQLKAAQD